MEAKIGLIINQFIKCGVDSLGNQMVALLFVDDFGLIVISGKI
jgi:hypothetical protein